MVTHELNSKLVVLKINFRRTISLGGCSSGFNSDWTDFRALKKWVFYIVWSIKKVTNKPPSPKFTFYHKPMQTVYKNSDVLVSSVSPYPLLTLKKWNDMLKLECFPYSFILFLFVKWEIITEKRKRPQIMRLFPLRLKNLADCKNCQW